MSSDHPVTGRLVQKYVRAKSGRGDLKSAADEIGRSLDPVLRSRVDFLGVDDERLLEVEAEAVMATIEELERNALLEDAGVIERAVRTLLNEQQTARPLARQTRLRWKRAASAIRKPTSSR